MQLPRIEENGFKKKFLKIWDLDQVKICWKKFNFKINLESYLRRDLNPWSWRVWRDPWPPGHRWTGARGAWTRCNWWWRNRRCWRRWSQRRWRQTRPTSVTSFSEIIFTKKQSLSKIRRRRLFKEENLLFPVKSILAIKKRHLVGLCDNESTCLNAGQWECN